MTLIILGFLLLVVGYLYFHPHWGELPSGDALERIKTTGRYRDDVLWNTTPRTENKNTIDKPKFSIIKRLLSPEPGVRPDLPLPSVRENLKALPLNEDYVFWLGHGTTYMQLAGKRILVDPMLSSYASPVPFTIKAFDYTQGQYQPEDFPSLDCIIITHDHWDHLDYSSMKALKDKVSHIICPLGVGAHLRRWGFNPALITECDWNDISNLGEGLKIHTLPARHFSGRGFQRNRSLWASFLIEIEELGKTTPRRIYLSADGGYDNHFKEIGTRFGSIDLAILENGQYNDRWRDNHLHPEDTLQAAKDLCAKAILPVHSCKFVLSTHRWDEPLSELTRLHRENPTGILLTPKIGEKIPWTTLEHTSKENARPLPAWWESVSSPSNT